MIVFAFLVGLILGIVAGALLVVFVAFDLMGGGEKGPG